jgi:hypothetical protein
MWVGLVIVLAVAAGGCVYLLSMRSLEGTKAGQRPGSAPTGAPAPRSEPTPMAPATPAPPPAQTTPAPPLASAAPGLPQAGSGTVYVPLALDERPPPGARLVRLLGLIALVAVAGLILAVSIWQVAAVVGDLLRHYLGG